jgi:hypothetical protein
MKPENDKGKHILKKRREIHAWHELNGKEIDGFRSRDIDNS